MGLGRNHARGFRARKKVLTFGLPILVAAAVASGAMWATSVSGAATCSVVGSVGLVVPTAPGAVDITRDAGAVGTIRVNGSACGTVNTIEKLSVVASPGSHDVSINFANGSYSPGLVPESGTSEIEFEIDGGEGADTLKLIGGASADNFSFGANGLAYNTDADVDITVTNTVERFIAVGAGGNDVLNGAGGVNGTVGAATTPITFISGAGSDAMAGGDAVDLVDYSALTNAVNVDLKNGTATGDGNDTLAAIENVNGTPFNDTVSLKPDQIETVELGAGDDVCKQNSRGVNAGGVEGDSCNGDVGNDTYDGSGILKNSPGITADFVTDKVFGSGPDLIPGIEALVGTNGEDVVIFQPDEINKALMGAGDDVCKQLSRGVNDGGVEGDTCDGGLGRDRYDATGVLRNSPGVNVDFITDKVFGSGPDLIPGVEDFSGTNGEDTARFKPDEINNVDMGAGDDVCMQVSRGLNDGGVEGDTCNGGPGIDTYDASEVLRASPGTTVDFVTDKVFGSGPDLIPLVENAVGTNGEDTFIDADDDCNLVRGGGEDDKWIAGFDRPGSENDPQRGQCGDDIDLGEGGEVVGDTLDYGNTIANSPGVRIDLPGGIVSGSPEDVAKNAENAFGSEHDDIIIGSDENNVIKGRGGNDTISGGGGIDDLDGGPGQDTLTSSGPNDGVTCTATGEPQPAPGETATNFEQCQAGDGNDTIYGTSGPDVLNGGGGNDTIYGLQGEDVINGGDGNDFTDGGNGNDTINGGAGNDEIHGGANGTDTLKGGDGDDRLFGGNGPDNLDGEAGNDTLDGGEGPDACIGESKLNCES